MAVKSPTAPDRSSLWITAKEAAEILGVAPYHVTRMVRDGVLCKRPITGLYTRFSRLAVEELNRRQQAMIDQK